MTIDAVARAAASAAAPATSHQRRVGGRPVGKSSGTNVSARDDLGEGWISAEADAVAVALRYVREVSGRRSLFAPDAVDAALAAGLTALALAELWWPGGFVGTGPVEGSRAVLLPTSLVMTVPLARRRRRPVAVALVVFGAAALQQLLTTPPEGLSAVLAVLVASYSAAAHAETTGAVGVLVAAFVLSVVVADNAGDAAFAALLLGGAWTVGRIVRRQNLLLAALAREQEAREQAAAADERARIARELHDVVAHSVSTMVVQAEAGGALLERDVARARDAFVSITASGRQALAELRRMLGLLRAADGQAALVPQPGLTDLGALVEQMRRVGLPVELVVEGEPRRLPPGVDVSAYRIVQEALTNTLKHALPARAQVTVRYGNVDVEVEVVDDGDARANGSRGGHGIAGMRERARLYGGTLETGRRAEGGFSVRARLPAAPA
jgi:signal transduction histidine kinase